MPDIMDRVYLYDTTDPRCGRHITHDPESWLYRIDPHPLDLASLEEAIRHERHAGVFNQGKIGSCTGNAEVGMLMTTPIWNGVWDFTENDALQVYELATRLDDRHIPGEYPPDDTGSSGLYASKAVKELGYIQTYHHTFGINALLQTLVIQPVCIGITWYNSMFEPNKSTGLLTCDTKSGVAGGHELVLDGIDGRNRLVWGTNSWDYDWGLDGTFCMSFSDLNDRLHEGGDSVTVNQPRRKP